METTLALYKISAIINDYDLLKQTLDLEETKVKGSSLLDKAQGALEKEEANITKSDIAAYTVSSGTSIAPMDLSNDDVSVDITDGIVEMTCEFLYQ